MREQSMPSKKVAQPPLYDPQSHLDPQQVVFVELYCMCGAIWRQRDPVEVVEPFVRGWLAKHQGAGHGPASKNAAVEERERRKEAVLTAAGRAGDYERKTYDHLDDTCTRPRPWPVFTDQQLTGQEG
jgi:hypothetical protein